MGVYLNVSPVWWSGLCALGGAACLALAVRNIFAREAAPDAASGPQRSTLSVDLPASGAGILTLAGLFFIWPEAVVNNHRSALYAMLCYSFWIWPDWARHILDPHVKHLLSGTRLRLSLALFGLSGLLTLLALVTLTQLLRWPGAVVTVLVGLTLVTVTLLGLFYAWLSALLLPIPAMEVAAADTDERQQEHIRERRWFWRALVARVAALLLFALGAWLLWRLTVADPSRGSLVVAGGFALALAAYVFVIWVDLGNDAERAASRKARAEALPPLRSTDASAGNGRREGAGNQEDALRPKMRP